MIKNTRPEETPTFLANNAKGALQLPIWDVFRDPVLYRTSLFT